VARHFGKARTQIHRWVKRYALDPERFRENAADGSANRASEDR